MRFLILVVVGLLSVPSVTLAAPSWQKCKGSKEWKKADEKKEYPYLVFFHTDDPASEAARRKLGSDVVDAALKDTKCFSIQLSKDGGDFMKSAVGGDAKAPAMFMVFEETRYERIDLDQSEEDIAKALDPMKMTAAEVLAYFESQMAQPERVESPEGWALTLPAGWKPSETKNQFLAPEHDATFQDNLNVVKVEAQPPPKPTKEVRSGVQQQIQASIATYKLRKLEEREFGKRKALLIDGQFVQDDRNVSMYQAVFSGLVVTCTIDSEREASVWPECEKVFASVELTK